jgi:hypothetical protein
MNDFSEERAFVLHQLCQIVETYGRSIGEDPARCRALLSDFCPGRTRSVHLLTCALQRRVPEQLVSASTRGLSDTVEDSLAQQLSDEFAVSIADAQWAVHAWIEALRATSSLPLHPQGSSDTLPVRHQAPSSGSSVHLKRPASKAYWFVLVFVVVLLLVPICWHFYPRGNSPKVDPAPSPKATLSQDSRRLLEKARALMGLDQAPADAAGRLKQENDKELYARLMIEIEPDLLLENIPKIDAKYVKQSAGQRVERLKWYDAAFQQVAFEFSREQKRRGD